MKNINSTNVRNTNVNDMNTFFMNLAGNGNINYLQELFNFIAILTGQVPLQSFNRDLFNSTPVTARDVIESPTFKRQHPDFKVQSHADIDLDTKLNFETASNIFTQPEQIDTAARSVINIGIERTVESMADRGVKYGFGDKTGNTAIDCSGLVQKALKNAFGLTEDGITVTGEDGTATISFNSGAGRLLATHSDGQIANIGKTSGVLRGDDVTAENLREGMVIGLDTGDKGWDRGRTYGVDHVGIVYRDTETGVLKFAQSSSSGGGVNIQDLDDWLESRTANRSRLFAVDPVQLGKQTYEAKPETAPDAKVETALDESGPSTEQYIPAGQKPDSESTSRTGLSAAREIEPIEDNHDSNTPSASKSFSVAAAKEQTIPAPAVRAPEETVKQPVAAPTL